MTNQQSKNNADTCKYWGCENEARRTGGYAGKFCSDYCEVRYDHIKADAQDTYEDELDERDREPERM